MKYKTRKIPGAPDWIPEGVVCKVWDSDKEKAKEEIIIGYWEGVYNDTIKADPHFLGNTGTWRHAEPIPVWEPTPGEYCAFWGQSEDRMFSIGKV